LQRFGHFNGAITRNGSALGNVVSADITYANNLDRIETIRNDGRIDGADPSIAALTGSIEVRFADQMLVTQAINGEACELEFAYAGTADKTATAATQVSALFGGATPPASASRVSRFRGLDHLATGSLRRMVLHYVHLCAAAGGAAPGPV